MIIRGVPDPEQVKPNSDGQVQGVSCSVLQQHGDAELSYDRLGIRVRWSVCSILQREQNPNAQVMPIQGISERIGRASQSISGLHGSCSDAGCGDGSRILGSSSHALSMDATLSV